MTKRLFTPIFLIFSVFNVALANDLKISIERIAPLIGGSSSNKDFLQSSGTRSESLGVNYYFGETQGFYLGLVYSKEYSKYTQPRMTSRPFAEFYSNYTSIGPEFGLWAQPSEKLRLEAGLMIGSGDFKFSDSESTATNSQNSKRIDVHAAAIYPSDVLGPNLNLDLFAKFGGYTVRLDEFTFSGITYTKSELELKYYIYICLGLGLRF